MMLLSHSGGWARLVGHLTAGQQQGPGPGTARQLLLDAECRGKAAAGQC
jgi:hypothetical protein